MSRPIRAWWPVLAWMAVIAIATSMRLPAGPLTRTALPLDKLVHFVLYLGLGWTLGRALWLSDRSSTGVVLLALAVGLAFGAIDEWHQGALLYRHASVADWLADAAGVSFGLVLYLWPRRDRHPTPPRARRDALPGSSRDE